MGVYRAKELLAPASLETVHRKIMGAMHNIEKEVSHFQHRHLSNQQQTVNPEWTKFVLQLCIRHDREIRDLEDFQDLKLMLHSEENNTLLPKKESAQDPKRKKKPDRKPRSGDVTAVEEEADLNMFETTHPKDFLEFDELKSVCERAEVFDYVAFSLKNQLETAYTSQLKKYCLSFEQDGKGETLNSVREYENRIIGWSKEIQGTLDRLDSILDEHDRYKSNVENYVSDYDQVLSLMSETCKLILETVDPVKKWVSSDATYARRIQEEINQYNRIKMQVKDKIKSIEDKRDEISGTVKRKAFLCVQLDQDIQRIKDSKKTMRRRELDLTEVASKINNDMKRKKRDLEDIKARLINRKENSPTVFNYLSSMNASIKEDIRMLEAKVRAHQQQVLSLQRDQMDTQKRIDSIRAELKENHRSHDQSYAKLEKIDAELRQVKDNLQQRENQIMLLKRIREIKLNTNTVKRIYHTGYTPGMMQNKDELTEAIRITAECLGRDWITLYQKLPFRPYRDVEHRSRDIEVIDLSTRRVQSAGFRTLAFKSLEKWRRLHNAPTITDLLKTLKRLRKTDIVTRVQKEVMLNSPVRKQRHYPKLPHIYHTA